MDEIDFFFIPMWIRVERLPMGLMNRAVAKVIGDDVGKFIEVDVDGGDKAAGRDLRLKIHFDIRRPLRRGVMVDLGADKGDRWCPITYEHLPDFCYICGLIGHVDRACSKKLGKDEPVPYSKELRFVPPRKSFGGFGRSGGVGSWRTWRSESGGSAGKSRADGSTWKKNNGKDIVKTFEDKNRDKKVASGGSLAVTLLGERHCETHEQSYAACTGCSKQLRERWGEG